MSKLKLRRDTAVNWASADPVLAAGEPGLDLTNLVLKLGDGATHWSGLTGLDVRGNYAAVTEPVALTKRTRSGFAALSTGATVTLSAGAFDQVDATGGNRTRKLAAGVTVDDEITVKIGAVATPTPNLVTIQGDSGVTAPTLVITDLGQTVTLVWSGSAWVQKVQSNPPDYYFSRGLSSGLMPVLDSSYDDTKFSAMLAAIPASTEVVVPGNLTLPLGVARTLTQRVNIRGEGTILDTRTTPTTAFFTLGPGADKSKITCRLAGSVTGLYKANHHAVLIQGTDNGAATPPTYVNGVAIETGEISGFGSAGVWGEFVKNATIAIDSLHDCGYAGIMMLSGTDVSASIRNAEDLQPGTIGDSYLIQFTRRGAKSDLVRYPNSKNSSGYVDVGRNIPQWDALGCHAGQGITLGFGSLYGVKKPVDVVGSTGDDGDLLNAPNDIVINLGKADSGVTDGSFGPAVTISGAIKSTDVLGSPTEYAKGIVINPGMLRGYGVQGTTTSGAIYCLGTQQIVIDAGSVREPSPVAICMYHDNKDFVIRGVETLDPWSTSGNAGIISIASTYNTGIIESAHASRGSKSATNVNNIGLRIAADASNDIKYGPNADFSSATQPINGTATATAPNAVVTPWTASTQVIAWVRYLLPTGGIGYSTTTRTTRASFDATEIAAWTFAPGGHYEKFTATTTRTVPLGITQVRFRLVGPGAGGGGGGSALTSGGVTSQVGGAGGGAGIEVLQQLTGLIGGSSTLAYTHVAGAAGGNGGAANSNAGSQGTGAGTAQLDSTTSAVVTTIKAAGGSRGNAGAANSTATVNAGVMGHSTGNGVTANSYIPGAGGVASNTGGVGSVSSGDVCGGTGGSNATATLGGNGGVTQTTLGQPLGSQQGQTGTTAGGNGANGAFPGHGGAGGGGGAPGGAGGTGGTGGPSVCELWY